jgi:hypothetical protein
MAAWHASYWVEWSRSSSPSTKVPESRPSVTGARCSWVRVLSGDEAAAALLRSLGFEKVTVVFEQLPAT